MSEIVVGQKLWYVPSQRHLGEPDFVEVKKIGRKWITVNRYCDMRVDKEKLFVDGGQYSSPGRCYVSKEQWEESSRLHSKWQEFRNAAYQTGQCPQGVTFEDIVFAMNTLGIK